ncbi:MAG: hypothetical protein LC126_10880 [Bryobacterales bacterium]|nr:hypothetical protein [Bryobacterales bacterium]
MRKKLWTLNLVLVVSLGLLGRQLRQEWQAARERERTMLSQVVKPAPPPPVTPQPAPGALQAAGYLDVAQQMLFSKDRNPNVVVEQAAPKPVPAFPKFYGVMNLGDGLTAILNDGPGRQRPFKAGDKVGEFKLAEIGNDALTLEWEDKKFVKRFAELQDRSTPAPAEAGRPAPVTSIQAAPPKPPEPARTGPGADMGMGISACNANDPSPPGTVVDGKRKVVSESPFGKVCRWEPVSK